ncbi:hypothetical protein [Sporosarcina ureilytica]|uniref:Uncharacterized protein n=1 Tax=Sporosarcina ureilytica TaxID=298596 RepID=A0A1D8JED6_9BACL|nr:hypothetical protein [Sporosarcina ureilytica]AOV07059.1 hypothetical protein BI350_05535 [Sporosarcina ureilytica]
METNLLFYEIQKGTVTTRDYVNWSYGLLINGISSPSLKILSSCSFDDNLFEIESYFKRSLKELAIKEPTFEACAKARIVFLAKKIVKADDHKEISNLADMIFRVVAIELDNSDDLFPWIEISELIDRLDYDVRCITLNKRDVISKIKNEARLLHSLDH